MGYEQDVCLKKIQDKGRLACDSLSLPYHCDTLTGVDGDYHDECVEAGLIYFQVKVSTCWNSITKQTKYFSPSNYLKECNALYKQDPAWEQRWCYCCCACFARDTLVAVPGGYAEMYTIPTGSKVLTRGVNKPDWSESVVKFSMGTGKGAQPFMVYIGFEDLGVKDLICTQEQPFLLSNGKFTTASKLKPGMELVNKDGAPIEIQFVSLGTYSGGVHHIATENPWTGNPDGHLILAGGVVAGDFEMQVKFGELQASLNNDVDNSHAVIGTEAYEVALKGGNSNAQSSSTHFEFRYKKNKDGEQAPKELGNGAFKTYSRVSSTVPIGTQSLLTEDQAKDVLMNCKQVPLSDPTPKYFYDTAQIQLNGYFPDIVFYLDVFDMLPNVYAFEAYGEKIVQVSGGLVRLVNFNFEGILMAMAHGVGCFYGGKPKVVFGYTAVGQADRYAFGNITGKLWLGDPAFGYINAAVDQWMKFFGYIEDKNRGGSNPLTDPSISCREEIIQSAPFGGSLPPCAGGTAPRLIELQVAQATTLEDVELIFNLPIDPDSADDVSNYTFVPDVKVLEAKRSSEKDFVVQLTLQLEPGISYKVTAKNLKSSLGTGLDPAHAQAEFVAPQK